MGPSARSLALALVVVAGTAFGGVRLEYRDDRLSGQIEEASPRDVLEAVGAATGAEVRGTPIETRPLSIELDAVPLDDALHRLLGSQNFTLSYGRDGRPKSLVLLGGPEVAPPPSERPTAAGVAVAPSGPTGPAFPLTLSRALLKSRPVPVSEPLAEVLGTDRATVPQLLEMATTDDDGVRRAQATQAVLSAFERQSRLRRSFLRTLRDLDSPSLAAIVNGENGPRFVSVIEYLAAHSREQALQKKASVILEQLQPSGGAAPAL
jgi:hypothetical protein